MPQAPADAVEVSFRLPDVGEGLTEAEIVSWRVRAGDLVAVNDPLVEIETAKSLVELPSPYAGVVTDLLVAEGQTVDVGTPIVRFSTGAQPLTRPGAGPAGGEGRTAVLVGYGPRTTPTRRRARRAPPAPLRAAVSEAFGGEPVRDGDPADLLDPEQAPPALPGATAASAPAAPVVLAKPPVRKLAKSLGVDLADVRPTGTGGVVTRSDVEDAARVAGQAPAARAGLPATEGGLETRIPVRGVRKATARAMVASAFSAPHVTEWVSVDVTRTVQLLQRWKQRPELAGVRVGPLLPVMRAVLAAVRRSPGINASWDEQAQEIVVKHYVNLGLAAATPRGLLVPNVKDAHAMTLPELAAAADALVLAAREGRSRPEDLQGGTFTLTNIGVFGVDGGTPILNPGEAAILALGAVRDRPWVVDGQVVPRKVVELALSFDHRLVDGELGARFLADVAAALEEPELLLLWT